MMLRYRAQTGRFVFALLVSFCLGGCWAGGDLSAQEPPGAAAGGAKSSAAAVRQYRDAVAFQNRGVYDLAADEWEKFLKDQGQDPLAIKAQHYLGVCRLQLKQYDQALAAFKKVIDKDPKFEMLDSTYLNQGLTQYSVAQGGKEAAYDDAAASFATLLSKFPTSKQAAQALFYQGESLYARGKKDEAAKAYAQLVEKHPDSPQRVDALYALGVAREELGAMAEAGAAYDQFLKLFPDSPLRAEVIMRRGETLFAGGQMPDAEKWFASAAASKGFALADHATMRQAASLYEQKKYAEAAALYAGLTSTFPQSSYIPAATLAAGNCYYLAGALPNAQTWLTKALAAGGESAPEAAHWLSRAFLKQQQPAEALKVVEKTLPQSAGSPFAVNLLMDQADALYEIDARRRESIPLYAAIAEKHGKSPLAAQALYMAGFGSLGQGDFQAAHDYTDRFLKQFAGDALTLDVQYVAAESDLQLTKYAEAETLYRDLLGKSANHADADQWKVRLGLALFLEKKFDEVAKFLQPQAARLKSPELVAEAQYLVGSSQYELQQYDAAAASLAAALTAAPKWRQADETLLNLAAAYRQLNQIPKASEQVRKMVADFPQSKVLDRAHFRLAEYAYAAGDYPTAAAEYQQVLDKFSGSVLVPHALYGLGWTKLAQKDYAGSAQALNTLIEKQADHAMVPRARYARAMARQQLQEFAPAIEDVQAFLKTNPSVGERSDALYVEGLCDVGLMKFDAAIDVFRSILKDDPKYAGADKVLYELGWALKSTNKEAEAAEAFGRLANERADSNLAAEGLYHVGEFQYTSKDYPAASKSYYAAMNKAGQTDLAEKATHKLAWAYYLQNQYDNARQSFESQAARFPQGDLASDAWFMAGESLFKQDQYAPALAAYQKALAKPPTNKDFLVLAYFHAAHSANQLKKWPDSMKLLEQGLKQFPESPFAPEMSFEQAWALQNQGKVDDAFKLFGQVADATDREIGARARYMMGEILRDKRDYKEAVRNYFKVAYGYGYPQAAESVQKWQANSAFEMGRCLELLEQPDRAKKSFKEVVDRYPKSEKAGDAKRRLEALGS